MAEVIALVEGSRGEEVDKTQPQALRTAHEHQNPNFHVANSKLEAIENPVRRSFLHCSQR